MDADATKDTRQSGRFSVGLTGGIGCGKTVVSDIFADLGAAVIDTDKIARALTLPGGVAIPAIRQHFGDDYVMPDGAMDRGRMRELVFSDAGAREELENILHPLIRAETDRTASEMRGAYPLYVVPLLIESGTWRLQVSRILVVDCEETLQIERVMRRSGLAEPQVRSIMSAQVSRPDRLAAADDVLVNDGDLAALRPQIERLHAQYCKLAAEDAIKHPQHL
jgi:dephospho-CoA kinase